jgi:hypothetical protein
LEWAKFAKKLELRKYMNVGFCFVFGSTGVWTQGVRQVLYYLSHIPSKITLLQLFFRLSSVFLPRASLRPWLSYLSSPMHQGWQMGTHHTQLIGEDRICLVFYLDWPQTSILPISTSRVDPEVYSCPARIQFKWVT